MEAEGSLPHSQVPTTCSYPKPDQSYPCPHTHFWRSILILSSPYALVFQVVSFLQVSPPKPWVQLPTTHTRYMSRPSHSSRFYNPNNIWWGIQVINLLVIYFSPLPCYLAPLRPNILLGTLFSNTLNLRSSLSVCDQVSHPYRTTGNIIVLYILIFNFLDSKPEDKKKDYAPNNSKHSLTSICS